MQPAPAQRLHVVRVLTALYALVWIVVRTDHWRDLARLPESRWHPVGIAGWLGGPPSPETVTIVAAVTFVVGVAALSGRRWSVAGPLFAVGFLWLTTFAASWGQILHTEHLAALHLLVLAAAPSGRGVSATAGWPLKVMTLVTVGVYVVAGIAKFRFGGGWGWLDGDRLLRLVAHDNLRKRLLGDPYSPIAQHVVGHPLVFRVGVWLTVVVELGAPVVLLGRRRLRTGLDRARLDVPCRGPRADGRVLPVPTVRRGLRIDAPRRTPGDVGSGPRAPSVKVHVTVRRRQTSCTVT